MRHAEAGAALIPARLDQRALVAPLTGIVSTRSAQVGEIANPLRPLLTIADLDQATPLIEGTADRTGRIGIRQEVDAKVDSFPQHTFWRRFGATADEADFTTGQVQTD